MKRYMLDSNTVSYLIRAIRRWFAASWRRL
jgi:hypothetical protein